MSQAEPLKPGSKAKPRRLSISRTSVRDAINKAEEDYRWCWRVLVGSQRGPHDAALGQSIVGFQPRLLSALLAIETVYRSIRQEEKRLIGRKAKYGTGWFRKRMATLKDYGKSLQDVLAIGRALGDSFAWSFYESESDLVVEHLKLQQQLLLPPLVGGIGERAALDTLQGFGGKLLIYHGTTTFLRLGDVSFVDLASGRLAAIGEIKTQHVAGNEYSLSVSLLADSKDAFPIRQEKSEKSPKPPKPPPLDKNIRDRLDRQMQELGKAFDRARKQKPSSSLEHSPDFHFKLLEDVVSRSHTRAFEWELLEPGLILGALRLKENGLGDRFLSNMKYTAKKLSGADAQAMKILNKEFKDNSLIIGGIGAGREELVFLNEAPPFCSWPISPETLEEIIFFKVLVVTIYNPAHFWNAVRSRGYEIQKPVRGQSNVASRVSGGRNIELNNLEYFHRLIGRYLLTQENVLTILDKFIAFSEDFSKSGRARVTLDPRSRSRRATDVL